MTTYPTSTVPTAKAWLFGQIQAAVTADPVGGFDFEVTYASNADTLDSPDDQVAMGDVTGRVVSPFALVGGQGQYALAEEYDLGVDITVYRPGVDASSGLDAETRAWALAGVVETLQRTDPTMGGVLITSRPNQSSAVVDWSAEEDANGRICTLPLSFHCVATL